MKDELEEQVLEQISVDEVLKHVEHLSEKIGARVPGSTLEYNGAVYVKNVLDSYGIPVKIETLDVYLDRPIESRLALVKPESKDVVCESFAWCASTHPDGAIDDLVYLGYGLVDDYKDKIVEGKIVLVDQGKIRRSEKVKNAENNGAVAVILSSSFPGDTVSGLGTVSCHHGNPVSSTKLPGISAVGITYEEGLNLKKMLERGLVTIRIKVTRKREWKKTWGVVATLKGSKKPEEEIWLDTHLDNWGPGAHDSGSQIAGILELARIMSKFSDRLDRTIKFAFWGAHEAGMIGSFTYVLDKHSEEMRKAILCCCAGATLGVEGVGREEYRTRASPELESLVEEIVEDYGIYTKWKNQHPLWSGDEHLAFYLAGVPVIENDGWYAHSKCYVWHTTGRDTYRHIKVDPQGIKDQIIVNGALLIRVSNSDVLPYDYSRLVGAIKKELMVIQSFVTAVDFSMVAEAAKKSEVTSKKFYESLSKLLLNRRKIVQLGKAVSSETQNKIEEFCRAVNKTLKVLIRRLILTLHTETHKDMRTGRFVMPFFVAVDVPPIQALATLNKLGREMVKLNSDSEESKALKARIEKWNSNLIDEFENATCTLMELESESTKLIVSMLGT